MNELTKNLTSILRPCAALIAYRTEEEYAHKYYLELRPIDKAGRMREARPVTYDFMNELSHSYAESHSGTPYGVVPQNLLYADTRKGSERYVWYDPPQRRRMYFRKSLAIENGEYNLPGVIYVVQDDKLEIYAYKGAERPAAQTELFLAPFFNVTGASVCLDTAALQKPTDLSYVQLLEYWEKKFWLTEFSHQGGNGNPTRSNLVSVTKAAHYTAFDLGELKPRNKTLKQLLR